MDMQSRAAEADVELQIEVKAPARTSYPGTDSIFGCALNVASIPTRMGWTAALASGSRPKSLVWHQSARTTSSLFRILQYPRGVRICGLSKENPLHVTVKAKDGCPQPEAGDGAAL